MTRPFEPQYSSCRVNCFQRAELVLGSNSASPRIERHRSHIGHGNKCIFFARRSCSFASLEQVTYDRGRASTVFSASVHFPDAVHINGFSYKMHIHVNRTLGAVLLSLVKAILFLRKGCFRMRSQRRSVDRLERLVILGFV